MQQGGDYRLVVRKPTNLERQKVLGRALRAAREGAGLQQIQLGERIGKTQGYISKIEGGHQGVDVLLLHDIATALEIDPVKLYASVIASLPHSTEQ